jgi:hypothetical protein
MKWMGNFLCWTLEKIMETYKAVFLHYRLNFYPYGISSNSNTWLWRRKVRPVLAHIGITVTATQALGYLLIGVGLLSWMAIVVSLVASSEEG